MSVERETFFSFSCILRNLTYFIALFFIITPSAYSNGELTANFSKNDHTADTGVSIFGKDMVVLDQIVTILPMETIPVQITKQQIPIGSQFLVIQAHAHNFNLTISYNRTLLPHYHVNGTNIGLVVPVTSSPLSDVYEVYVTNFNISRNVSALIAAVAYGMNVPVPGGCNMVFPIEISPFLGISYDKIVVRVDLQAASSPSIFESCEYSSVELEMYHSFLPERDYTPSTYFRQIRRMLTVDRIKSNGVKVNDPLEGASMRRVFAAYTGTGSAYGIVAVYEENGKRYESAYIPAVTYACSTVLWADTCQVLTTTFAKVVCAVLFFMGLFLCLCGHMFFQSQIFIHTFLSGAFVSILILDPYLQLGLYPASICFGLGLAFICVIFWKICALPFFHIILISLNVGVLLASIAFFAGLGDVDLMDSDINFWVAFGVFVLSAPSVLVYLSHKACIVASGVLGAYAVIVPIDHYIGSNLKYIILNTIRRAIAPEFRTAVISPPFQFKDLTLTVVWFTLSVVGISMQLFLQRASPPFPPPPRDACGFFKWCCPDRSANRIPDERTPLLVDARIPRRTPPEGYDDVFEPTLRPSAPHIIYAPTYNAA
ncbi:transmembrane 7 superfamily member 3-like [Ischnura elegans]|uniref:transmembrane 7 superfamily member 3-like n=1 Tax=Ischnura elegans TaxID=197161 RepID=UPI001ED888A4|nr:transmembrane 7 superfamily member 3-like [Ischnura elegans]